MLFEIYFNHDGEFRTRPKAAHIEQVLREVCGERYARCREFIRDRLEPHSDVVPFMPGTSMSIPLRIVANNPQIDEGDTGEKICTIESVTFLDETRLMSVQVNELDPVLTRLGVFGRRTYTARQIRSELSENFVIPEWAIQIELPRSIGADQKLVVPDGWRLNLNRPELPIE